MDSPEEKPVLGDEPPTGPQGATRATRIVAGICTVILLAVPLLLWRAPAHDSSMAAIAGAVFCVIVALGIVRTGPGKRR